MESINALLIFLSIILGPSVGYFASNAHDASHSPSTRHLVYIFATMTIFAFLAFVICVVLGAGAQINFK